MGSLRLRFWVEALVASITGILCVVTPIWPDWIEVLTDWDPDQHSGNVEWIIAMALLVVTVAMLAMATREWQRSPIGQAR